MSLLRNWKVWLILGVMAFVAICMTGCGANQKCLRGHYETRVGIISWMMIGKTMTPVYGPKQEWVCDEYATEGSR